MIVFQRRSHPSWHFTAICGGIVVGVAAARLVPFGWGMEAVFLGGLLGVLSIASRRTWLIVTACAAGILIGLARGGSADVGLTRYRSMIGQKVSVTASVRDDIDTNPRGQKVLKLSKLRSNGEALPGTVWMTTQDPRTIRRSDVVRVEGKLSEGFGSFAATMYDARIISVERPSPGDIALEVRDRMSAGVAAAIHEPAASLGIGYLLGQKGVLPRELTEALVVTGLTHIVVASGYNLTILVRLARRIFERISKYLTALFGMGLVAGFIAITGMSPSMSRAGLVAGLSLWAWYYGRNIHPVTLLLLAMSVTLLVNPSYAWGDVGWALSFAAFAGVMILAPLMQAYFWGAQNVSFVGRLIIETISAIIMTMPITMSVFGSISVIALIANVVIVPLVPIAMLLVFIAGVFGMIFGLRGASIVGWPAQILLDGMIALIGFCSQISWAQISLTMPGWGIYVWYGVLTIVCVYLWGTTHYRLAQTSIIE